MTAGVWSFVFQKGYEPDTVLIRAEVNAGGVAGLGFTGLHEGLKVKMPRAGRGIELKIPEIETFHAVQYAFGYWHDCGLRPWGEGLRNVFSQIPSAKWMSDSE